LDRIVLSHVKVDYEKVFFLIVIPSTVAFLSEDAWVYFNAKSNQQSYFDSPLLMLKELWKEE
jgi:hypothetical protein